MEAEKTVNLYTKPIYPINNFPLTGWRCKVYGHRTGDKECPMFVSGNKKSEKFRVVSFFVIYIDMTMMTLWVKRSMYSIFTLCSVNLSFQCIVLLCPLLCSNIVIQFKIWKLE